MAAPEIRQPTAWVNSPGTNLADLRGKVVVLHFWTFGCINCQRNLPHYNRWQQDFQGEAVEIIGIHTPELSVERDIGQVRARVKQLGIRYPVAIDNAHATWRAYSNRYWPCIYLIDKRGQVRYRWDGELEYQGAGGEQTMRKKIAELLAEKP